VAEVESPQEAGDHEALLEDSAEDLYEHAPCGYLSTYPDGRIARVNQTFLSWTGYDRAELLSGRRFVDLLTVGGRIYHETHYAPLLRMQGSVRAIAMDLLRADGTRMPVLVNAHIRTDAGGQPLAVRTTVFDAGDRKLYETELLAARRRAEQAAARLRVIEQVVADLAAVSRASTVCDVIASAGTSAFGAAASAVWLADDATGAYRFASASGGSGPARDLPPDTPVPKNVLLRHGEVVVVRQEDAPETFPFVTAGLGSGGGTLVLTPLAAHARTLGVLALRLPDTHDPDHDELTLLQTLGRQAGQALERARLYDAQTTVATTLQRSMLPTSLPDDPRLSLSASYRPAVDGLDVGGDWYDAFRLDPDRVAVVVGDVVGRGLNAAAAMGQLRSAIRALATADSGPALLLDRLDRFVDGVEAADTATMVYAEVDVRTGVARYACAGHPPPVLVDSAGQSSLLWEGRSAPLGAHFGVAMRPEAQVTLAPGSRLLFYTDGLVERRDAALDQCIEALAQEFSEWADRPFDGIADQVADTVLGTGRTGDDVCLLAISFNEHPTFGCSVLAELSRVAPMRSALTTWLVSEGVAGDDLHAAVLACSEAVSNAIEHGYKSDGTGVVDVVVTVTPEKLRLRVRDKGRWRPPLTAGERGRGVSLMKAVMDDVKIDRSGGTIISMARTTGQGLQP